MDTLTIVFMITTAVSAIVFSALTGYYVGVKDTTRYYLSILTKTSKVEEEGLHNSPSSKYFN